jgi:hypothetical protein
MKQPFYINDRGKLEKYKHPKTIGWTVKEVIGVAIINPRALSKIKIIK